MEEGGKRSFTASTYKGSDEVIEFPCVPCTRQGITTEAVNYCADCSEYFCSRCTKDHAKFGLTASHKVVDRKKAKQADRGKKPPVQLPTERCKEHNDELIKLFCRDHNVVVCNTCVSMDHRSCDGIFQISQVSGDTDARQDVSRVKGEISTSLEAMKSTRSHLQRNTAQVDDDKMNNFKIIDDNAERLIQHVQDMRQAAIVDVMQRHKEETDAIATDIAEIDLATTTLENRYKNLDNFQSRNHSQVFVDVTLGSREAHAARQLEQRLTSAGACKGRSTFEVDDRVNVVLNDVNSLGQVNNWRYKAVVKGTYCVGMNNDTYTGLICDSLELPGGEILITDYLNVCVKALNASYEPVKRFVMPASPWGICQTRPVEIAVTLTEAKKVQFVDISGRWKLTTSFNTNERCRGLAHNREELFVSCGGWEGDKVEGPGFVGIFGLSGSLLRKIQKNDQGQLIFSMPLHIVITHNIHVADISGGVINVDTHGNIKSVYKGNIKHVIGLCRVDTDNLIVCGKESNNVFQITTDGKLVAQLLSDKDGINAPRCVKYSPSRMSLAVMFSNSNEIKVYNLR